jgi:hypothetical protein
VSKRLIHKHIKGKEFIYFYFISPPIPSPPPQSKNSKILIVFVLLREGWGVIEYHMRNPTKQKEKYKSNNENNKHGPFK